MPIHPAKLASVGRSIARLRDALKQYCLAPDKLPVSLEDLSYAVEQLYELKVRTQKVDVNTRYIRGAVEFYPDRIEIYLLSNLDNAAARFVFAKELGQLILKDAENVTDDPVALIDGLIQDQRLRGAAQARADVLSEQIAYIVAIELLFPFELRTHVRKRIEDGESTLADEATRLDIPEYVVELAISNGYAAVTLAMWGLPRAAE